MEFRENKFVKEGREKSANAAFQNWVRSGLFTISLSPSMIEGLSYVYNAQLFKKRVPMNGIPAGTSRPLVARGLIIYANDRYKDGAVLVLTEAGNLICKLLVEAKLLMVDSVGQVAKNELTNKEQCANEREAWASSISDNDGFNTEAAL